MVKVAPTEAPAVAVYKRTNRKALPFVARTSQWPKVEFWTYHLLFTVRKQSYLAQNFLQCSGYVWVDPKV